MICKLHLNKAVKDMRQSLRAVLKASVDVEADTTCIYIRESFHFFSSAIKILRR